MKQKIIIKTVVTNLTMCNCRGDSARRNSSDERVSNSLSTAETWGEISGIKSCTSASTGGGEGCLISCVRSGGSIGSKEIREGSSVRGIWTASLLWVQIGSKLGLSGSELLAVVFFPLMDCSRLYSQKNNQMHIYIVITSSETKIISWNVLLGKTNFNNENHIRMNLPSSDPN